MLQFPNTNDITPEAQEHFNKSAIKLDSYMKLCDLMISGFLGFTHSLTEKEIDDAFECRLENIKGHIEMSQNHGHISKTERDRLFNQNEIFSESLKAFLKSELKAQFN